MLLLGIVYGLGLRIQTGAGSPLLYIAANGVRLEGSHSTCSLVLSVKLVHWICRLGNKRMVLT